MKRALQIGGLLLLGAVSGLCDQKTAVKDPPPPPAAKKNNPKGVAAPKGGLKGTPLINPANPFTRLFRMTPEQRERALEQLPPQQQANARKSLEAFDQLPKEQQDIQLHQLERFEQLPPERRAEVRGLWRDLNQLPRDRNMQVRQAIRRLQNATDAQREAILKSAAFKERFSPEEQRIISGLADARFPQL